MLVRKPYNIGVSKIGDVTLDEKEVSTIPVPVVISDGQTEGDTVTVSQFECESLEPIISGLQDLVSLGELSVAEVQAAVNVGLETLLSRRERSRFIGELRKKHGIVSTSTGETKAQEFVAFG